MSPARHGQRSRPSCCLECDAERQARLQEKVQDAARLTRVLREFQRLYSSEVIERLKPMGVKVSHDYTTQEGTVPLPPTRTVEMAGRLARAAGVSNELTAVRRA